MRILRSQFLSQGYDLVVNHPVANHRLDLSFGVGDCAARPRGTITMDNLRYGRYSGEIQLMRQDLPADERVNVIGRVDPRYLLLVDCIRRGSRFKMVRPPREEE